MSTFGDIRGRALWVVIACAIGQMALGTSYAGSVLVPAMLAEFDWSRGDFMAASSPRMIVAALASPLIGVLTYRFGARPILVAAVMLTSAVFGLYAAVHSLAHVFALSVASGLVIAGVGDIVVGTVVSQWVVRARGLALGIVYSGSNFGGLVFSLIAARVLLVSDWRIAYLGVGVVVLVALLPVVALGVREPYSRARAGLEDAEAGETASRSPEAPGSPGVSLRDAMHTATFWLLFVALFLFYFYYVGVTSHLVLFLTDIGMSTWAASTSFGLTVFLGVGAKIGIGLVADRWPPKTALLIDFGFVTIASFVLLALPAKGLLPVFVVAHGLATAAQNVVYPLIVAWCFGVKQMAKIYGVLMLALLPGGVLGPVFAGYMFEALGSYDLTFQIFAGLNVFSFAALCLVRRA
jgi:MFS family permease